ncbi:hypothetical protein HMPREF9371_0262 [Neisseria shayeganii 871]|uniref:Uncharacterized protein n=1 Tax=Neisseria shayeganii 871 TaxID=1032488 RepID=G4CF73_9NEIS|nr:hypothetical protein HMPREF9371_0262 [Neisseria shayeganii 871]
MMTDNEAGFAVKQYETFATPPSAAHFCVVRLCPMGTVRSLSLVDDMSVLRGFLVFTFTALLRLERHPHLGILQRFQILYIREVEEDALMRYASQNILFLRCLILCKLLIYINLYKNMF